MGASAYASPAGTRVYYQCPHNPANPRHAAAAPDHPRTVKAPETRLDQIVGLFFTDHVFGPRRAELLAAQLPATDAAAAADRDAAAAAIRSRLKQIDTAQNSCILELEQLPADPADTAAAALRGRIRARFADLHPEREQLDTQLAALAAATPRAADPALLDELPLAGDILPGLPADLKARLLDAFDIQILWNKPGGQATVHAEITDATLRALPGLLNPGQDGYDDTSEHASGEPVVSGGFVRSTYRPPDRPRSPNQPPNPARKPDKMGQSSGPVSSRTGPGAEAPHGGPGGKRRMKGSVRYFRGHVETAGSAPTNH